MVLAGGCPRKQQSARLEGKLQEPCDWPWAAVVGPEQVAVGGRRRALAVASASDLTFNWTGFISAMVSNLTFGFRAVWSKKCAAGPSQQSALVLCFTACPPLTARH